jgi:hypothetical protein
MSDDLTFSVMIDSQQGESDLMRMLLDGLAGAQRLGGYIKYRRNVLKLERNSLHDEVKASARDDKSWMYYRYSLNVFPEGEISLVEQKSAASSVLAMLDEAGVNPEPVSEFEL